MMRIPNGVSGELVVLDATGDRATERVNVRIHLKTPKVTVELDPRMTKRHVMSTVVQVSK